MDKPLNPSDTVRQQKSFLGLVPGQERFAFLYVVIAAAAVASVMIYSGIARLHLWQTSLMLVGTVVVGWAALFSILEVRRLSQSDKDRADEAIASVNPYTSQSVVVEPPTADPYPHHEDYAQSAGFDQGQLTSRLPDATPLVGRFSARQKQAS